MVKFNLRIFRSCQTEHSSPLPEHSSPPCQGHKEITGDLLCTTSPSPSKHRSSFKSHVASAFRCGSRSGNQSTSEDFQSQVVAKVYDVVSPRSKISFSSAIAGVVSDSLRSPLLPVPPFYEKKSRRTRNTKPNRPKYVTTSSANSHRFSTSYTVDDGGEDEERSEILSYPRRSFSDVGVQSRHTGGRGGLVSPEWGSPARLSVFKKLMPCKVEGKVKESFAVVKRSEKPYEDFKKSMMEMIVENQMYEESDLKQLLQCFLSLNSWYHHDVIMKAFSEIWNTIFLDR